MWKHTIRESRRNRSLGWAEGVGRVPEAVRVEADGRGPRPGVFECVVRCGARIESPVHATVRWPGWIPMVEEATMLEEVAGERDRRAVPGAMQVRVAVALFGGEIILSLLLSSLCQLRHLCVYRLQASMVLGVRGDSYQVRIRWAEGVGRWAEGVRPGLRWKMKRIRP